MAMMKKTTMMLSSWLCLLFFFHLKEVTSFQVWTPSLIGTKQTNILSSSISTKRSQFHPVNLCMASTSPKLDEYINDTFDNKEEESSVGTVVEESELDATTKFWNAMLLIAAFGYALYSLVNIDHGMTRGWTQSEVALRIPLDNWASYEASLNNKPVWTKTFINVIIYLLGDWLSQTVFAKKPILEFDASRTLRNGFIGLCFGPLVHLYYEFSDHILPVEVGVNRLYKIGMDQTIYLAVKCSIYIMAVNILAGESIGTAKDTVQTKLPNIMLTAWKFWPLVHCVTYGVIPARHRILWVNSVDLIWNAILATQTSQKEDNDDTDDDTNNTNELLEQEQVSPLALKLIETTILDNQDGKAVGVQSEDDNDDSLLESTSVVLDNTDDIPSFDESNNQDNNNDDDLNEQFNEIKDLVLESSLTTSSSDSIFNDSKNSTINLCTSS